MFLFVATLEPAQPKELVSEQTISNYSNLLFDYKIMSYPTGAEIVPYTGDNIDIGIVSDPWNIKFGIIPGNGSYGKRYISIKNSKGVPSRIELRAYGNISPLINFSANDFVLNQNQSSAIEVSLYTDSAGFGNYSGEIDVISKTPKYGFLGALT